ncbi:hypothetical protein [Verrucosispora sp. TAA-831]|uniref:hypothetical protein n=1 Tax=Verrucosispora sp. TAA-831 TaxID=3422227 RepID=UPI003D6DF681
MPNWRVVPRLSDLTLSAGAASVLLTDVTNVDESDARLTLTADLDSSEMVVASVRPSSITVAGRSSVMLVVTVSADEEAPSVRRTLRLEPVGAPDAAVTVGVNVNATQPWSITAAGLSYQGGIAEWMEIRFSVTGPAGVRVRAAVEFVTEDRNDLDGFGKFPPLARTESGSRIIGVDGTTEVPVYVSMGDTSSAAVGILFDEETGTVRARSDAVYPEAPYEIGSEL